MIELEKTYLAKYLPEGLKDCRSIEIIDIYIPDSAVHPTLRIRKNGDKYNITKKEPIDKGDFSRQEEQVVKLTEAEFNELAKLKGKRVEKTRYLYDYNGRRAEFDVFKGALQGLAVVDFEFGSVEEKDAFPMPEFCLVDVTQEKFIAGGMLAGKSYEDIEKELKVFSYQKISSRA